MCHSDKLLIKVITALLILKSKYSKQQGMLCILKKQDNMLIFQGNQEQPINYDVFIQILSLLLTLLYKSEKEKQTNKQDFLKVK